MHSARSRRWQQLIEQVALEYRVLPRKERQWIRQQLQQVAALQRQLNSLFERGNGQHECRDCFGKCCAKGHNHMTLVNLLGYLQQDELPPAPDFSLTCPFLSDHGCRLPIASRPYNCISFVCDIIENSLTSAETADFYTLENQLRSIYVRFAERYTGGGLTGLLLQAERLDGRPFLALKPTAARCSCRQELL